MEEKACKGVGGWTKQELWEGVASGFVRLVPALSKPNEENFSLGEPIRQTELALSQRYSPLAFHGTVGSQLLVLGHACPCGYTPNVRVVRGAAVVPYPELLKVSGSSWLGCFITRLFPARVRS